VIPLIAVVGPTASGKTSLAIELARRLDTEILSADSMQFYRGMEIGTAAPTPDEQAQVPHHFVSFLNPNEEMAAGQYEGLAREQVARLAEHGKPAVVVGGSGLYVNALVDGLFPGPKRDDAVRDRLRIEAEEIGNAAMLEKLRTVDPAYAATLTSENDLVRIVRALEVYELTGRPFSALHADHQAAASPLPAVRIGLDHDREVLYERIDRRVEKMIADDWVKEVEGLIANGYEQDLYRLKALGFREMADHLRGEQSLEETIARTQQHHRRYAKRQLTWFRNTPGVHWLPITPETTLQHLADTALTHYTQSTLPSDRR
jgi:tRNA dimethylallyltransferase